jgi:ubiquinone/menaquinone biosynthesis C-methylase UbiE
VQTGLDSEIADVCLLAFILHEVKESERLMAEAFRLLKPEGKVVVVEWKAELDSPGPPQRVRLTRGRVEQLFKQVGLALVEYIDWSGNHYVAVGGSVSVLK